MRWVGLLVFLLSILIAVVLLVGGVAGSRPSPGPLSTFGNAAVVLVLFAYAFGVMWLGGSVALFFFVWDLTWNLRSQSELVEEVLLRMDTVEESLTDFRRIGEELHQLNEFFVKLSKPK